MISKNEEQQLSHGNKGAGMCELDIVEQSIKAVNRYRVAEKTPIQKRARMMVGYSGNVYFDGTALTENERVIIHARAIVTRIVWQERKNYGREIMSLRHLTIWGLTYTKTISPSIYSR